MLELVSYLRRLRRTPPSVLSTFLRVGVPFLQQGNFGWGESK
jgi:hypothetical protein